VLNTVSRISVALKLHSGDAWTWDFRSAFGGGTTDIHPGKDQYRNMERDSSLASPFGSDMGVSGMGDRKYPGKSRVARTDSKASVWGDASVKRKVAGRAGSNMGKLRSELAVWSGFICSIVSEAP
jgi:hypothetical protein